MPYKDPEDRRRFDNERYKRNVLFVRSYKVEQGCVDCGYNEHHAGLEFDHLGPRLRGTVAAQLGKSMKCILEEIERCEVVCRTCHGIRTWTRNGERFMVA